MGCTAGKKPIDIVEHAGGAATVEVEMTATANPDQAIDGIYHVTLFSGRGLKVGANLGKLSEGGAVIVSIEEGGLFHQWNQSDPTITLEIGHIITEADGATGYYDILQRLSSPGDVKLLVQGTAQGSAACHDWSSDTSESAESTTSTVSSSKVRLFSHRKRGKVEEVFACLDEMSAGDLGVSECCVCLADVPDDAMLVPLRCGHAVHACCASPWLLGSTGRCPLCLKTAFDSDNLNIMRENVV
jgi:hypothetical protein